MASLQAHKHELEQQIAEKQAAAEALQAEHAGLKGQHTMLAMLLDTQQSAVNILQEQEQVWQSELAPCLCIVCQFATEQIQNPAFVHAGPHQGLSGCGPKHGMASLGEQGCSASLCVVVSHFAIRCCTQYWHQYGQQPTAS